MWLVKFLKLLELCFISGCRYICSQNQNWLGIEPGFMLLSPLLLLLLSLFLFILVLFPKPEPAQGLIQLLCYYHSLLLLWLYSSDRLFCPPKLRLLAELTAAGILEVPSTCFKHSFPPSKKIICIIAQQRLMVGDHWEATSLLFPW